MLRVFLLSLACAALAQSMDTKQKIKQTLDKWNGDVACWGKENALNFHLALMQASEQCANFGHGRPSSLVKPASPWQTVPQPVNSPFQTLPAGVNRGNLAQYQNWNTIWANYLGNGRQRRETKDGLLETDEEDFQEFLDDFEQYKEDLGSKMGNLTCVMSKLNMLDSALQVNIQEYTSGIWDKIDLSKTLAGSDPLWRQMMVSGYTDCFSIAQTWPQESLNRNPLSKVFGRHMIFFKCAMKVEKKCCYEAEMYDWIKTLYGEDPTFNWSQFGLPNNKYELAALTVKVMTEAASDEEKFVGDFFYGDHHM